MASCVLLLLAAPFSSAQQYDHSKTPTYRATRIDSKIVLDGQLEKEVWNTADVASHFIQKDPDEGKEATEKTELRILYDDAALYVGVRLYDSQPANIVRRLSRRDDYSDSDTFTLYLDPRHDHLTGALFEISSAGVQRDAIISNDNFTDYSWDGIWEAAVRVDDTGWCAELRIPFSQLRFAGGEHAMWGINASRFIHRKNETSWLELVPKKETGLASRMAHLDGMDGIESASKMDLMPYVVGKSQFLQPGGPGDPFAGRWRTSARAGLDVKYRLSGSFTLDATVNPDFGQVEVDPAVVNLTQFETFFPEKRPFFIEGSQIFNNFGRGGASDSWGFNYSEPTIFYSRRIGRAPQLTASGDFIDTPPAATILGASKLTGKTRSGWSVGLLEAVTAREFAQTQTKGVRSESEVEPLTNYFVARVERERGTRAGFGMLMTGVKRSLNTPDLRDALSKQAYTSGVDGYLFLDNHKEWVVNGRLVGSWVSGSAASMANLQNAPQHYFQRPDVTHVHFDPKRTSLAGWTGVVRINRNSGKKWGFNAQLWGVNPGFESNDVGFGTNGDIGGAHAVFIWKKIDPDRWTRYRQLWFAKWWTWDYARVKQSDGVMVGTNITFSNYWYSNANIIYSGRAFDDKLTRGGPVALSPEAFSSFFNFGSDGRKTVSIDFNANGGYDEMGGWNVRPAVNLNYKPTSSVRISTGPEYFRARNVAQYVNTIADQTAMYGNRYVFADIDQSQLTLTTRANWTLSPRMSLQVFAQPLISLGRYWDLKEITEPRAFRFARYGIDKGTIFLKNDTYTINPETSGSAPSFDISNPTFNFKSLRVNAVFRWEWRLGSTFYLVWTQNRTDSTTLPFNRADITKLFTAPANNVFLVRLAYWFGK